jgi:DNA-binding winged helix-turn-helix (wHTH) protein/TolB-like protein/Flp pilus assembly protein TadD
VGPGSAAQPLCIGDWLVEPALNRLVRGAEVVHLEPKAVEVLIFLARRPGEVVSREALLEAVWPGVVVGDSALTQPIVKLRKALGEDPKSPAYIETIAKRGYRLIAPVAMPEPMAAGSPAVDAEPDDSAPAPGGGSQRTQMPPTPRGGGVRRVAGWTILAGALTGAGAWLFSALDVSPAPVRDAAAPAALQQLPRADAHPTVTVLQFQALGNDPQQRVLAAGIAGDLATDLSKVSGLRVVGAPFGTAPDGNVTSPKARYVVSGDVQRADERLRVRVQLTDTESGRPLWAERFDRPFADLFALQDQLSGEVVAALQVKVSEAEMRRMARRHTRSLEAYEHFLRGQVAVLARSRADNETARSHYRKAMELDPAFARAYAGLAYTHSLDYRNQWTSDGAGALARAQELAESAQQIGPDLPETYWVLAHVHAQRRQHVQALAHLQTAIGLNPSYADAYAMMGDVQTYLGRPKESVPLLRTAMRLHPEANHMYFTVLGRAYFFLGDAEQARVNLREAIARNPANLEAHVYLAATLSRAADPDAAWEAEEIRSLQPGFKIGSWLDTYPMTDAGQKAQLVAALGALGL